MGAISHNSEHRRLGKHAPSKWVPVAGLAVLLLLTGFLMPAFGSDGQEESQTDKTGSSDPAYDPPVPPKGVLDSVAKINELATTAGLTLNQAWYEPDSNAVVAYLPPTPADAAMNFTQQVSKLAEEAKGYDVRIVNVERSMIDTMALQDQIENDRKDLAAAGITMATLGITPDGATIKISILTGDFAKARQLLTDQYGPNLEILRVDRLAETAASRQSDYAPWWGGDRYSGLGGQCTSGFAVTKPGYGHYMPTAGHCSTSTGQSANYYFTPGQGSSYMGYVTQRDRISGQPSDDALVTGSYGPYVWSGPPNGTSALKVIAANTAATEPTAVVCLSGSFTGQACRATITSVNQSVYFKDGVTTKGLTEVYNVEGNTLCQLGDSGGPVYDGYLPGGVRARGIIIGLYGDNTSSNLCYYLPWQTIAARLGSSSGNLTIDVG